ncbi:MAG: tetratricopeptide repeat protein [Nitrospirae bacterium]|nr:tetratricopeptide repeat protein [Nitrospirota bacterium]
MEALIIRSYCIRICRTTAWLLLVLLLSHAPCSADDRETEMFNAGYEYLFSFKPDKAAETFRAFLKEFPDSSARDAAMFWLGKTLVSLKSYAEAEQTFRSIKQEFPESPFVSFIDNEMEEIAKQRSSGPVKGPATPPPSKSAPEGERTSPENDARVAQLMAERDRLKALLEEEKRSAAELQQRNSDLMAKGAAQTKHLSDAEERLQKLSGMESVIRDTKEEREKLSAEAERLRAEKSRMEKERDDARQQLREYNQQQRTGDSLILKISELEQQVWQKDTELAQAKEVQEKLRLQSAQDRKSSDELRSEVARLKDTEKEYRSLLAKTPERQSTEKAEAADASTRKGAAAEARKYREQLDLLQAENRDLSLKVETMEQQAEQRIKDMKILNSYLTKLMFIRKEEPKPKVPSPELEALKSQLTEEKKRSADLKDKVAAAEARETDLRQQLASLKDQKPVPPQHLETKQPVQAPSAQTAAIMIRGKQYPLSTIVTAATASDRTLEKLGLKAPVWRSGDPLDDFINEQLLSDEAMKTGALPDEKKYQDIASRLRLAADETAYLRKFMLISSLIDRSFKSGTSEPFIETLTVDFRSGDASAKTVLATGLQQAARSGKSFEDIQKMYRDSVKFSRLTVDDFAKRHKDKSQIIKKLDFKSEETIVMWSEKGYMLLKPVTMSKQFDPFADTTKEDREKIKTFLSAYIAELRKNM